MLKAYEELVFLFVRGTAFALPGFFGGSTAPSARFNSSTLCCTTLLSYSNGGRSHTFLRHYLSSAAPMASNVIGRRKRVCHDAQQEKNASS